MPLHKRLALCKLGETESTTPTAYVHSPHRRSWTRSRLRLVPPTWCSQRNPLPRTKRYVAAAGATGNFSIHPCAASVVHQMNTVGAAAAPRLHTVAVSAGGHLHTATLSATGISIPRLLLLLPLLPGTPMLLLPGASTPLPPGIVLNNFANR